MKSARRQAREIALQALYAWQLSGGDPMEQARALEDFGKNSEFTESIVRGVHDRAAELQGLITPHLDRAFARLSPVERAILYIGAFELAAHAETPFKVVINEAIELGKSFGGTMELAVFGHMRNETDRRIDIGTSTMTWDCFASTAGSSINAESPGADRRTVDSHPAPESGVRDEVGVDEKRVLGFRIPSGALRSE